MTATLSPTNRTDSRDRLLGSRPPAVLSSPSLTVARGDGADAVISPAASASHRFLFIAPENLRPADAFLIDPTRNATPLRWVSIGAQFSTHNVELADA